MLKNIKKEWEDPNTTFELSDTEAGTVPSFKKNK